MCRTINNVEWSGIIFCKTEGHPVNPDTFSVRAIDILPMHKGEPTYTEFEIDDSLIDAYDNNPELEECKMGIIHSHVNMGVFFSGTDTTTLNEYAKLSNFCISVIVNNKGEIIAKAAYPINRIVKSSGQQYKDADGNWVTINDQETEQEIVSVKSIDLNIVTEMGDFFLNRVDAITAPKVTKYGTLNSGYYNYENNDNNSRYQQWYNDTYSKQTSLFDTPEYSKPKFTKPIKPHFTKDQINNFLCMCALLDGDTKLVDTKSTFESMDVKVKDIEKDMYEAYIYDNVEAYYIAATNNTYVIGSEIEEFVVEAMEEIMSHPLMDKSDSLSIVYDALVSYYHDYLPNYL